MDRIAKLRSHVAQHPGEAFPRYALALELKSAGDAAGAAAELEQLTRSSPEYLPTYLMLGMVLQQLDRLDEARAALRAGQDLARRQGNSHTLSELTSALEAIP
jgi:Flp pilus assembly protein TadD